MVCSNSILFFLSDLYILRLMHADVLYPTFVYYGDALFASTFAIDLTPHPHIVAAIIRAARVFSFLRSF